MQLTVASLQHLPMYIEMGWETGIYNEFRHLQSRGLSKAQLIEMVMFCQLSVGIRGLQHVYNAVGKMLPDWRDGPGPAPLPEGWAPDPDAFKCGLDLSTQELTDADRQNMIDWYERTHRLRAELGWLRHEVPSRLHEVAARPLGDHLPASCPSRWRRSS